MSRPLKREIMREKEILVKFIVNNIGNTRVRSGTGKIIDLTQEENTFIVNSTRIKARFMNRRDKTDVPKYLVNELLPKAGRFWVALNGSKDGDDISIRDRRASFMINPPVMECAIRAEKTALFGRWCFTKSVGDIGAIDD